MTTGTVLAQVIVGASGIVCGLSLYLAVRGYREYRGRLGACWAMDRLGIAVRIGLLAVLVWGQSVSVTWMTMVYLTGVLLSLFGGIGLAMVRGKKLP